METTENKTAIPGIEVVTGDQLPALQKESAEATTLANSFLARLGAMARMQTAADQLKIIRTVLIRATLPQDWTLFRDKEGNTVGMIRSSGADRVAPLIGLKLENYRPLNAQGLFSPAQSENEDKDGNKYMVLSGGATAWSNFSENPIEVEGSRAMNEDFIGRGTTTDLRLAVLTLLKTKAVRIFCSFGRVPLELLQQIWGDSEAQKAGKGSGYGSASARAAGRVAEEGVAERAALLWKAIVQLTGGGGKEMREAKSLLKAITSSPGDPARNKKPFAGFDDIGRIAYGWQLDQAIKNLRADPEFGERANAVMKEIVAAEKKSAAEPEAEREPGEEG